MDSIVQKQRFKGKMKCISLPVDLTHTKHDKEHHLWVRFSVVVRSWSLQILIQLTATNYSSSRETDGPAAVQCRVDVSDVDPTLNRRWAVCLLQSVKSGTICYVNKVNNLSVSCLRCCMSRVITQSRNHSEPTAPLKNNNVPWLYLRGFFFTNVLLFLLDKNIQISWPALFILRNKYYYEAYVSDD